MFEVIQHRVGPRILEVATTSGQHCTWNRQLSRAAAKILLRLHFYYALMVLGVHGDSAS